MCRRAKRSKNGCDMQKWWRYVEMYMVYGGHRNKIWWKLGGKMGRWMEMLLPGAGCPGGRPDVWVEVPMSGWGRMSGLYGPDVQALDLGMNTAWRGQIRAKFGGICGWKMGQNGWEARSTQNKANSRIQTNKISTHQQITKKFWGYFWWGIFELGRKTTK